MSGRPKRVGKDDNAAYDIWIHKPNRGNHHSQRPAVADWPLPATKHPLGGSHGRGARVRLEPDKSRRRVCRAAGRTRRGV